MRPEVFSAIDFEFHGAQEHWLRDARNDPIALGDLVKVHIGLDGLMGVVTRINLYNNPKCQYWVLLLAENPGPHAFASKQLEVIG